MWLLTDKQISNLKYLLFEYKKEVSKENIALKQDVNSLRDSVDELSTVDNHPADLATELYEREKDMALATHGEATKEQIEAALIKIENGTYGICETCHNQIAYERLEAIPYTQYCVEHSKDQSIASDRPIEETVNLPPIDDSFSKTDRVDTLQDAEDSFRVVSQYGSSDTPADFVGDYESYMDLFVDIEGSENFSEMDVLHVSETEQLRGQISKEYAKEARAIDYVDDENSI